MGRTRSSAAWISVTSNLVLIVMKVVAGVLTGSIAILTEAIHSSIDLVSSVIALLSVKKAEEPADEDHPYGHEKAEHVGAGAEAMLILVGAGIVIFEAVRRLFGGGEIDAIGIGIAIIAASIVLNLVVSGFLYRRAAHFESPALEGDAAHLRADALTSIAVLVGLALVEITGYAVFDSIAALVVAGAIVGTGVRLAKRSGNVLMDRTLPDDELDEIEAAIAEARPPSMAGYHKLRARRAGSVRHVDLHVQFREGTSLERAHQEAHELRDAIEARFGNAEVLIHVEPEDSYSPPEKNDWPLRSG